MPRENDIKGKVVELLGGAERALQDEKPRPKKKPRVQVSGRGNVVGVGDHVHIKHQVIERPLIQPGADAISAATARQVQNAIENLVDIDEACGVLGGDRPKLFAKWYRAIKDRYGVPSYRTIAAVEGDGLLAWLDRQARAELEGMGELQRKRLAEIRGARAGR